MGAGRHRPDRAERLAHSITDESAKVFALRDMAHELAATDPGRAERLAQSITDAYLRAEALSVAAQALAEHDRNA